jgi:hypothetical protein
MSLPSTVATPTEPAKLEYASLLGQAAVLVWNDIVAAGREQFYAWHDKEHIPERLAIPGFRRGRRFINPGHSPEWLTMYEADDLGVMVSPEYLHRLNSPTPGTISTLPYFHNTSRAVCKLVHSLGSSSGGYVLALRLDVTPENAQAMCEMLKAKGFPRIEALTGALACHLYAADHSASHINTAESSTREFDVPSWVVLVEASTSESASQARVLIDELELDRYGAVIRRDAAIYSLEICRLST